MLSVCRRNPIYTICCMLQQDQPPPVPETKTERNATTELTCFKRYFVQHLHCENQFDRSAESDNCTALENHCVQQFDQSFMCSEYHAFEAKSPLDAFARSRELTFTLGKTVQRKLHVLQEPRLPHKVTIGVFFKTI